MENVTFISTFFAARLPARALSSSPPSCCLLLEHLLLLGCRLASAARADLLTSS